MNQEIYYKLIFNFINFSDMMNLRQLCHLVCNCYNQPCFWRIVNLTKISTQSYSHLLENININSKKNQIYNLSGRGPTFNYPISLGKQLYYCKLLIL